MKTQEFQSYHSQGGSSRRTPYAHHHTSGETDHPFLASQPHDRILFNPNGSEQVHSRNVLGIIRGDNGSIVVIFNCVWGIERYTGGQTNL